MKQCITIQTKKNEVVLKIEEKADQKQILIELNKKMPELKKLYKEDTTPISVVGKPLTDEETEEIQELIKKELNVKIQFNTPKILGLHGIKKAFSKEIATSETKFYRGSIRSGKKVEFEGSLVILGDVNAGAEVLAGENVVVLGILRGMAHAGAKGNKEAIIAAASIESAQIRIANIIKEIEREEDDCGIKNYAYVSESGDVILE